MGEILDIFIFFVLIGLRFIEEANIYIFWKKKSLSAHLDPILVNCGQKVNIRLFNQKLIIFWYCNIPINLLVIFDV